MENDNSTTGSEDKEDVKSKPSTVDKPEEQTKEGEKVVISLTSSSSIIGPTCRICFCHSGRLVRPCNCSGSIMFVHDHCLNKWVNISASTSCQVCRRAYQYEGVMYKPIKEWNFPRFSPAMLLAYFLFASLIYCCWPNEKKLVNESLRLQRIIDKNASLEMYDYFALVLAVLLDQHVVSVSVISVIQRIIDKNASLEMYDYFALVISALVVICLCVMFIDSAIIMVRGSCKYLNEQKMRKFKSIEDSE